MALVHSVRSARVHPDSIPFELRMLEVLLEQTVRYLEDKSNKIKMLSRAVQDVRSLPFPPLSCLPRPLPLRTLNPRRQYGYQREWPRISSRRRCPHCNLTPSVSRRDSTCRASDAARGFRGCVG